VTPAPELAVERIEVLLETPELKVSLYTFAPGQEVPWHAHSEVDDTFVCVSGRLKIETRAPHQTVVLAPGESGRVAAGRPHRVSAADDDGRAQYVLVQGVGRYDFKAVE